MSRESVPALVRMTCDAVDCDKVDERWADGSRPLGVNWSSIELATPGGGIKADLCPSCSEKIRKVLEQYLPNLSEQAEEAA